MSKKTTIEALHKAVVSLMERITALENHNHPDLPNLTMRGFDAILEAKISPLRQRIEAIDMAMRRELYDVQGWHQDEKGEWVQTPAAPIEEEGSEVVPPSPGSFQWAIETLLEGRRVKRPQWWCNSHLRLKFYKCIEGSLLFMTPVGDKEYRIKPYTLLESDITANDWEEFVE